MKHGGLSYMEIAHTHTKEWTLLFFLFYPALFYTRVCVFICPCACQREINTGNFPSLLPRNTSANLTLTDAVSHEEATASENK